MAPMDEVRQNSQEELQRRQNSSQGLRARKLPDSNKKADGGSRRDGGSSGGSSGSDSNSNGGNGNGNGDGGGNGGSGGKGGGGGGGGGGGDNASKDNNNGSGSKKQQNNPSENPPGQQADPPSKPTEAVSTPSATTVVLISTTTAPAPAGLTTPSTSTSVAETFRSSFFPTTTSFLPVLGFTIPTSAATSSQPRKGLNTEGDPNVSNTSTSTTKTPKSEPTATATQAVIPQTALNSASTTLSIPDSVGGGGHHKKPQGLSPLAEQLLIAAGAIGAFIIIATGIFFFTRMMKVDILSKFRNRTFSRGGARGWYGWRRQSTDYSSDPPPVYPGEFYPADEKAIPAQRQLDAFFSPMARPPLATPAGAAALTNTGPQRQETDLVALLDNPAPLGVSPEAQAGGLSATHNFYNISPQNANLSRQPGTQASQNSQVSALSQKNTTLSRQPGTQASLLSQANSNYINTGTQNTFLTMQTADAYDPNQREVNHLSYLSSLSSGFGDGLVIADSTVNSQQFYRQSQSQGAARFSWATSARDRDTVYTQASIESAPRFRTVNSWVAQQSSRVERQRQSNDEVPAMPPIPLPLQAGVNHHRKPSEDPAFRAHPGDEIPIPGGSRVPSEILDKTIGFK